MGEKKQGIIFLMRKIHRKEKDGDARKRERRVAGSSVYDCKRNENKYPGEPLGLS